MEVEVGGGTATRDRQMTPKNASYYIGGTGVKTTESNYQGTAYDGQSYGGGLLTIYSDNIVVGSNGKFTSTGKEINGSCWAHTTAGSNSGPYYSGGAGGGSGGGSINIFYNNDAQGFSSSNFQVNNGQYSPIGTYNVGKIGTGTYIKLLSK